MRGQLQKVDGRAEGRRARLRGHHRRSELARPRRTRRRPTRAAPPGTARLERLALLIAALRFVDGGLHRGRRSTRRRADRRPRRIGALRDARALRRRHREHQLLRRHRPGRLRADACSSACGVDELPFYLELMKHLAAAACRCPSRAPTRTARFLLALARQAGRASSTGCPASITSRPMPPHCASSAPCSRACTWRRATSRRSSRTCAASPGGRDRAGRRARTSTPRARRADAGRARLPAAPRTPSPAYAVAAARRRSTPTCSATTCMFDGTDALRRRVRLLLRRRRPPALRPRRLPSTTGASTSTSGRLDRRPRRGAACRPTSVRRARERRAARCCRR